MQRHSVGFVRWAHATKESATVSKKKVNQVLNLPIQVDSRYWIGGNWVAVGAFLPDTAATAKLPRVGPRRK